MDEKWILAKLLLFIPELRLNLDFVQKAMDAGLFSKAEYEDYARKLRQAKKIGNVFKKMSGKTVIERIMVIAPELMSVQTVNLLRKLSVIDEATGHKLRLSLKAIGAIKAVSLSDKTMLERMYSVLGPVTSNEFIALMRSIDDEKIAAIRAALLKGGARLSSEDAAYIRELLEASVKRAEEARGILRIAKTIAPALAAGYKNKDLYTAVFLFSKALFSEEALKGAVRAGLIPAAYYDDILAVSKMGLNVWTKANKSGDYTGWFARSLLISEGILSPETIAAARQLGLIDKKMARLLNLGVRGVRIVSRRELAKNVSSRKYTPLGKETPLQTYARINKNSERYLLSLLQESSNRTRKDMEALLKSQKYGKATRAAQQAMMRSALKDEMQSLAELLGYGTVFGQKEAARAGVESMEWLQKTTLGRLNESDRLSLQFTARAGINNFVSRAENRIGLSTRVYGNYNVWTRRIDKEINIALLRGLSAKEFADSIAKLIDPNVRGGVSYAAMRLARTEINNAFHFSSIRSTRDMPWIRGYKWNLSGSHGRPDICNEMADKDHNGLGKGVYAKKNVPGKPHPHCLCYVTTVDDGAGMFEKNLRNGKYKDYLEANKDGGWANSAGVAQATGAASNPYMKMAESAMKTAFQQLSVIAGTVILREVVNAFTGSTSNALLIGGSKMQ